eukprot:Gb_33090 [translate_table: standard]
MNTMGRQMQQVSAAMQYQRPHQYSENGVDSSGDAVFGKWLQSAGLQHLAAAANLQDHANYGIHSTENKPRMYKASRSMNGGVELLAEPSTPPVYSRSSSQKNMEGALSPSELSPGILDLHAIDTELLSEDLNSRLLRVWFPELLPLLIKVGYPTTGTFIYGNLTIGHRFMGLMFYRTSSSNSVLSCKPVVLLLRSVSVPGLYDSTSPFIPVMERGFENDSDLVLSVGKQQTNRLRVPVAEKSGAVAKIKVVVRKRPLNKKEIAKKEEDIITIEPNCSSLTVHETKLKVDLTAYVEKHEFVFDAVLDDQVSNEEVYQVTVEPIVPTIFQRTKATCFAYGQTGKFLGGKTFTMQPLPLKAAQDILRLMHQAYKNQGFQLCVSFFEIYGGKLYDLLSERRKLCMREDGKQQVCIVGLQEFRVSDVETIKDFIEKGNAARSTGTTGANEESSRSHAILQLVIKRSVDGNESKPGRVVGKLSFIDLAGSERGADTTDNDRQTRMEGAEINKSLLALKECIRALDNDQGHIPFRGSKLTEVLRDSFVGDSRTVMISCISPNSGSCEHTLNTLRYADRVKSLSKTNSSKKDSISPAVALRESSTNPLTLSSPSPLLSQSTSENINLELPSDSNRFGWHKQLDGESRQLFTMDHGPPSGRDDGRFASVYADNSNNGYDSGISHESQEQGKQVSSQSWRKGKTERYQNQNLNPKEESIKMNNNMAADRRQMDVSGTIHSKFRSKDAMDLDMEILDPDEELDAILKEEEDLVIAHRKQVEDTIDIVREEMKLLAEADQPGNQIDGYISKLNDILSQKAAGIISLQTRLARFQRLLSDQNILTCPAGAKFA